jgi:hypothetical protein
MSVVGRGKSALDRCLRLPSTLPSEAIDTATDRLGEAHVALERTHRSSVRGARRHGPATVPAAGRGHATGRGSAARPVTWPIRSGGAA